MDHFLEAIVRTIDWWVRVYGLIRTGKWYEPGMYPPEEK